MLCNIDQTWESVNKLFMLIKQYFSVALFVFKHFEDVFQFRILRVITETRIYSELPITTGVFISFAGDGRFVGLFHNQNASAEQST